MAPLNHEIFCLTFFHLVTWDDLDLYYGHKAQEMILTDVSDTIHGDSLALFALNIEILLADVTKPEKSKILTLTWPVTSSVTSGSNFWPCTGSSRTELSNGVWNLEIGPVVWEISGGGALCPPPPSRTCCYPDPSGARVIGIIVCQKVRAFNAPVTNGRFYGRVWMKTIMKTKCHIRVKYVISPSTAITDHRPRRRRVLPKTHKASVKKRLGYQSLCGKTVTARGKPRPSLERVSCFPPWPTNIDSTSS